MTSPPSPSGKDRRPHFVGAGELALGTGVTHTCHLNLASRFSWGFGRFDGKGRRSCSLPGFVTLTAHFLRGGGADRENCKPSTSPGCP